MSVQLMPVLPVSNNSLSSSVRRIFLVVPFFIMHVLYAHYGMIQDAYV